MSPVTTPYAPPSADAPPPLQQKPRSSPAVRSLRVLGILSIIFASLAIATTLSSGFAKDPTGAAIDDVLARAPSSLDWKKDLAPYYRRIHAVGLTESVLYLGMSAILLFMGIGLTSGALWMRTPTIIWSVTALVLSGVFVTLQAAIQAPALSAIVHYVRKAAPTGIPFQQNFLISGMEAFFRHWWISLLLYGAYPTILLCLLMRRSIRQLASSEV